MARKRLVTGLTRGRERAVQDKLRVRIENAAAPAWAAEINRAMQDYANEAAGTKNYGAAQIRHQKAVHDLVLKGWRQCFAIFGTRILDAGKKFARVGMEKKDAAVEPTKIYDKAVNDWVRRFGATKVTEIAGTTVHQAMRIINAAQEAGINAGENEIAVGKAIRASMAEQGANISQLRSRIIARTEAHASSTAATHEAGKALDFPTRKEWISATDDRVRPSHAAANGTTVPMDEAFVVEGENMQYPGDPTGSAENVVNCRCVEGIVVA